MAENSGITAETLEQTIRSKLEATSPQFEGKTSLAKSRLVNANLKEEIAQIHAWSNKTYTPAQWEKLKEIEAGEA
ncbi:hypothetical protein TWF703_007538 [Orbilia oligospora]|uniref:Uncharacterized protein n=1 Tax=Orbilia oligospora TaxID=2813651 RepID=A0A7C8NWI2_ORBOL|nr:hypothetical protein TWF703_007538 [Orbilia oligospora]